MKNPALYEDRLMEAYEEIDSLKLQGSRSSEFLVWHRRVRQCLEAVFGSGHLYTTEFADLPFGEEGSFDAAEFRKIQHKAFLRDLRIASTIISDALDEIADNPNAVAVGGGSVSTVNSVFVVHGHEIGIREAVARFLERGGLDVTILHERPDHGRTIIEKFEDNAERSLAIILLTPDDPPSADEFTGRPRQNVILEFGFFLGRLGRKRVIALKADGTQLPSDYSGVLYIRYVEGGDWKERLAREIRERGLRFDSAKALA